MLSRKIELAQRIGDIITSIRVGIVDIGGDHRYVEGWAYGLDDVWPDLIRGQLRVANPDLLLCFRNADAHSVSWGRGAML